MKQELKDNKKEVSELLSRGELRFTKYGVGDSEIDYEFNSDSGFDALNAAILRPGIIIQK